MTDFLIGFFNMLLIVLAGFSLASWWLKDGLKIDKTLLFALSWVSGCVIIAITQFYLMLSGLLNISIIHGVLLLLIVISLYNNKTVYWAAMIEIKQYILTFRNFLRLHNSLQIILCVLILFFGFQILVFNAITPVWSYDGWLIWTIKAKLLHYNFLDIDFFKNKIYDFAKLDYPMLVPVLQAFITKLSPDFDERLAKFFFNMCFIIFGLILYNFIRNFFDRLFSLLLLFAILFSPFIVLNFISGYADAVLAKFYLFTIVVFYRFFNEKSPGLYYYIAFVTGFAGLMFSKNEGSIYVVGLVLFSLLYIRFYIDRKSQHIKYIILSAVVAFLLYLPWVVFIKHFNIANEVISGTNISLVSFTVFLSHFYMAAKTLIVNVMFDPQVSGALFYLLPITIYLAIQKNEFKNIFFFCGIFFFNLLLLLFVYALTPFDPALHVVSSANRVLMSMSPAIICFMIMTLSFRNNELSEIETAETC